MKDQTDLRRVYKRVQGERHEEELFRNYLLVMDIRHKHTDVLFGESACLTRT